MSEITQKIAIFGSLLLTSFCFWKAAPGLVGGVDAPMLPSAQAALSPAVIPPRVVTTPIQEMRPGMRVVGRNPIRIQTESTIDPTPEGWRLVSVRMLKPDGTYFEAELLRPLSWISRHRAQPGAVIELNMPELHVVGAAAVLSISDCPPIDAGDGPIALSTFKNIANNVLNIYVEGETEPIGVTAGHPIWNEDRQAFVHSDRLQPGERLRSALGKTVRITSIEIRAGPEPVYNLEVAGEHVYSVTGSGLLVHNTGPCDLNATRVGRSADELLANGVPHRTGGQFHRWFDDLTPDEFDSMWANPKAQATIRERLLFKGGHHEWLVRSRANVFKRWGLSVQDIANTRQLTNRVNFKNNPFGGAPGGHVGFPSESARWHNELIGIVDSSTNFTDFKRRLNNFADYRLDGGRQALPKQLRE